MATDNKQQRSVIEADSPEWMQNTVRPQVQDDNAGNNTGNNVSNGAATESAVKNPAVSSEPSRFIMPGVAAGAPAGAVAPSSSAAGQGGEQTPAYSPAVTDPEATGVENVAVGNQAALQFPHTPETAQEAVDAHFAGGPYPEAGRTYGSLNDVVDMLQERVDALRMPSKEQLEKERRRKRTQGIISSIADAASAVSNLIFTTKYAPNMYNPADTMTGKWRERWDKLSKEREVNADRALNYALTIRKLIEGEAENEYKRGRDALQDRLASIKAANAAKLSDIKYRRAVQQLSDAEAAAEEREANRELEKEIKEARRDAYRSQANKNDRWIPSQGRGGSGSKGGHPWRDDKGKLGKPGKIYYESSATVAREMAGMHGGSYMITPSTKTTTKPNKYGQSETHVTVTDTSITPDGDSNTMPGVKR